jgi:hypothetical protein
MKKSELRKIIRESISEVLSEGANEDLKAITKLGFGFKGKVTDKNWLVGQATLPNIGDVDVNIQRSDEPDKRGIELGRILNLWISRDSPRMKGFFDTLTSYDGRWRTQPKEPEVKKFVAQIIKALS